MKYFKQLLLSVALVAFVFVGACSSGGSNPPNQSEVNLEFQDLIIDIESLNAFLDFFGATDCASLVALINSVTGTIACDEEGTSTIEIDNIVCNDGPPLTVSFNISQTDNNCEDFAGFSNGNINGTVTFDGNEVIFNLSSPGITGESLTFTFNGFLVTINSSNVSTCSGSANVNGDTCTANSDCSGCTLQ